MDVFEVPESIPRPVPFERDDAMASKQPVAVGLEFEQAVMEVEEVDLHLLLNSRELRI